MEPSPFTCNNGSKGTTPMWAWFFGGLAAYIALVAGIAAVIACCAREAKQRADAFKVLKYVGGGGGVAATAVGFVLKLHQAGLL